MLTFDFTITRSNSEVVLKAWLCIGICSAHSLCSVRSASIVVSKTRSKVASLRVVSRPDTPSIEENVSTCSSGHGLLPMAVKILFFGRLIKAFTATYHAALVNVSGYGNAMVRGNKGNINFTVIVTSSHLVNSKLDTLTAFSRVF